MRYICKLFENMHFTKIFTRKHSNMYKIENMQIHTGHIYANACISQGYVDEKLFE